MNNKGERGQPWRLPGLTSNLLVVPRGRAAELFIPLKIIEMILRNFEPNPKYSSFHYKWVFH